MVLPNTVTSVQSSLTAFDVLQHQDGEVFIEIDQRGEPCTDGIVRPFHWFTETIVDVACQTFESDSSEEEQQQNSSKKWFSHYLVIDQKTF